MIILFKNKLIFKIKMIEICLKHKIIYDFLKNYKQKKWSTIIPSLIEISILNLYNSFKKLLFSEEELFLIIENLKIKNRKSHSVLRELNQKEEPLKKINDEPYDIGIRLLRKKLKLNLKDKSEEMKESYRSYTKKARNINQLNIYTNDYKRINIYNKSNKSSDFTPAQTMTNNNETETEQTESKFKNNMNNNLNYNNSLNKSFQFKFRDDNLNKGNKDNKIKNEFKTINNNFDLELIENNQKNNLDYININDKYQSKFNIYNNINHNINYSLSIDNNNKKYIKVHKNNSNNNNNKIKKYNIGQKLNINKDNYYANKRKELTSNRIYKNQDEKNRIINSESNNISSFTLYHNNDYTRPILKENENKIKISLNNANYYMNKKSKKILNKTIDNSIINNSPTKRHFRLQKFKNNLLNRNKHSLREFRNNQFPNIKKNYKFNSNRNNLSNTTFNEEKILGNNFRNDLENDTNNNTIGNINDLDIIQYKYNFNLLKNNTIGNFNFNDINLDNNKSNTNVLKKKIMPPTLLIKSSNKKIINYNSFNNGKFSTSTKFLNEPLTFKNFLGTKK